MREIKFRAWHKDAEQMFYPDAEGYFDAKGECSDFTYADLLDTSVRRPHVPMQFTGLTDKNGDKKDNRVSNLEWTTWSENQKHAVNAGLATYPKLPSGEEHPASKLTNIDVQMMVALHDAGFSHKLISNKFGVHSTHVSLLIRKNFALTGTELNIQL